MPQGPVTIGPRTASLNMDFLLTILRKNAGKQIGRPGFCAEGLNQLIEFTDTGHAVTCKRQFPISRPRQRSPLQSSAYFLQRRVELAETVIGNCIHRREQLARSTSNPPPGCATPPQSHRRCRKCWEIHAALLPIPMVSRKDEQGIDLDQTRVRQGVASQTSRQPAPAFPAGSIDLSQWLHTTGTGQ